MMLGWSNLFILIVFFDEYEGFSLFLLTLYIMFNLISSFFSKIRYGVWQHSNHLLDKKLESRVENKSYQSYQLGKTSCFVG